MKDIKLLSLVVPAFKQEKTIVENIRLLEKVLSKVVPDYEIIVVVDGYCDKTSELLKQLKIKNLKLKIFGYEKNQGKGYAVQYGILKAKGDVIGFIDAGMDIDPSSINSLILRMQQSNADIVVGSKLHPNSKIKYPLQRKILSWGYRTLTRMLFGYNVRDTQVGLKLFKGKAARDIFSKVVIKGFAFDIEVLGIATALGYKIEEAPINVKHIGQSTIKYTDYLKLPILMFLDTARVWYRLRILHTYVSF